VNGIIVIFAGLLAAALAFTTNWLALYPWRRAKEQHWTQRARLYHPVRIAAASNLWVLPAVLTLMALLLLKDESPHWAPMAVVTAVGALAGTLPMDREVFPRVGRKELLHQAIINWLIRFLCWAIFLTAVALMPSQLQITSFVITAAFVALCIFWSQDGWIRVGRWLGLFTHPPERLQSIVAQVSRQMNVPVRETCLMQISWAQAFAMPGSGRLLFTRRLLELLSHDELAAVCAHELAHLT
jgi:Zn-dependent protease with chaperone function